MYRKHERSFSKASFPHSAHTGTKSSLSATKSRFSHSLNEIQLIFHIENFIKVFLSQMSDYFACSSPVALFLWCTHSIIHQVLKN